MQAVVLPKLMQLIKSVRLLQKCTWSKDIFILRSHVPSANHKYKEL